jgi:hypothetical protein
MRRSHLLVWGVTALLALLIGALLAIVLVRGWLAPVTDTDCAYSTWSTWSGCEGTCRGVATRTRAILQQSYGGGVACDADALYEATACASLQLCAAVNCSYTAWHQVTACPTNACVAGDGSCLTTPTSLWMRTPAPDTWSNPLGVECALEDMFAVLPCTEALCPQPTACVPVPWEGTLTASDGSVHPYSISFDGCPTDPRVCSTDGDVQLWEYARRGVLQPASNGGPTCAPDTLILSRSCGLVPSCTTCELGPWSAWSECTAPCGGGVRWRVAEVLADGDADVCDNFSMTTCNEEACPTGGYVAASLDPHCVLGHTHRTAHCPMDTLAECLALCHNSLTGCNGVAESGDGTFTLYAFDDTPCPPGDQAVYLWDSLSTACVPPDNDAVAAACLSACSEHAAWLDVGFVVPLGQASLSCPITPAVMEASGACAPDADGTFTSLSCTLSRDCEYTPWDAAGVWELCNTTCAAPNGTRRRVRGITRAASFLGAPCTLEGGVFDDVLCNSDNQATTASYLACASSLPSVAALSGSGPETCAAACDAHNACEAYALVPVNPDVAHGAAREVFFARADHDVTLADVVQTLSLAYAGAGWPSLSIATLDQGIDAWVRGAQWCADAYVVDPSTGALSTLPLNAMQPTVSELVAALCGGSALAGGGGIGQGVLMYGFKPTQAQLVGAGLSALVPLIAPFATDYTAGKVEPVAAEGHCTHFLIGSCSDRAACEADCLATPTCTGVEFWSTSAQNGGGFLLSVTGPTAFAGDCPNAYAQGRATVWSQYSGVEDVFPEVFPVYFNSGTETSASMALAIQALGFAVASLTDLQAASGLETCIPAWAWDAATEQYVWATSQCPYSAQSAFNPGTDATEHVTAMYAHGLKPEFGSALPSTVQILPWVLPATSAATARMPATASYALEYVDRSVLTSMTAEWNDPATQGAWDGRPVEVYQLATSVTCADVACASAVAASLGLTLASTADVAAARADGAQLCSPGWTSDDQQVYPMQTWFPFDCAYDASVTVEGSTVPRNTLWVRGAKPVPDTTPHVTISPWHQGYTRPSTVATAPQTSAFTSCSGDCVAGGTPLSTATLSRAAAAAACLANPTCQGFVYDGAVATFYSDGLTTTTTTPSTRSTYVRGIGCRGLDAPFDAWVSSDGAFVRVTAAGACDMANGSLTTDTGSGCTGGRLPHVQGGVTWCVPPCELLTVEAFGSAWSDGATVATVVASDAFPGTRMWTEFDLGLPASLSANHCRLAYTDTGAGTTLLDMVAALGAFSLTTAVPNGASCVLYGSRTDDLLARGQCTAGDGAMVDTACGGGHGNDCQLTPWVDLTQCTGDCGVDFKHQQRFVISDATEDGRPCADFLQSRVVACQPRPLSCDAEAVPCVYAPWPTRPLEGVADPCSRIPPVPFVSDWAAPYQSAWLVGTGTAQVARYVGTNDALGCPGVAGAWVQAGGTSAFAPTLSFAQSLSGGEYTVGGGGLLSLTATARAGSTLTVGSTHASVALSPDCGTLSVQGGGTTALYTQSFATTFPADLAQALNAQCLAGDGSPPTCVQNPLTGAYYTLTAAGWVNTPTCSVDDVAQGCVDRAIIGFGPTALVQDDGSCRVEGVYLDAALAPVIVATNSSGTLRFQATDPLGGDGPTTGIVLPVLDNPNVQFLWTSDDGTWVMSASQDATCRSLTLADGVTLSLAAAEDTDGAGLGTERLLFTGNGWECPSLCPWWPDFCSWSACQGSCTSAENPALQTLTRGIVQWASLSSGANPALACAIDQIVLERPCPDAPSCPLHCPIACDGSECGSASGRGHCDRGTGACVCTDPTYESYTCWLQCPLAGGKVCGGHGTCLADGTCGCDAGWMGATCTAQASVLLGSSVAAQAMAGTATPSLALGGVDICARDPSQCDMCVELADAINVSSAFVPAAYLMQAVPGIASCSQPIPAFDGLTFPYLTTFSDGPLQGLRYYGRDAP